VSRSGLRRWTLLGRSRSRGLGGEFLFVEVADDAGDVGFGFVVRRHAVVLFDALGSGIVGGEGFDEIEVVALEEFAEIARAGVDVGLRIEGIVDAELRGGLRHELHQSLRAFGRDGADVESAFGADDAGDKIGIELVSSAGVSYGLIQIEGMRIDGGGGLQLARGGGGSRCGSRGIRDGFEVADLGGGNVDKAGLITVHVKPSDVADDSAALVADGESVAEDRGVGGEARQRG